VTNYVAKATKRNLRRLRDKRTHIAAIVTLKTGESSAQLISDDGRSEFYERRERRDLCAEEISWALDLLCAGIRRGREADAAARD
jgi:hypothetical protein